MIQLNKKKASLFIGIAATTALIALGFQNCSDSKFSKGEEAAASSDPGPQGDSYGKTDLAECKQTKHFIHLDGLYFGIPARDSKYEEGNCFAMKVFDAVARTTAPASRPVRPRMQDFMVGGVVNQAAFDAAMAKHRDEDKWFTDGVKLKNKWDVVHVVADTFKQNSNNLWLNENHYPMESIFGRSNPAFSLIGPRQVYLSSSPTELKPITIDYVMVVYITKTGNGGVMDAKAFALGPASSSNTNEIKRISEARAAIVNPTTGEVLMPAQPEVNITFKDGTIYYPTREYSPSTNTMVQADPNVPLISKDFNGSTSRDAINLSDIYPFESGSYQTSGGIYGKYNYNIHFEVVTPMGGTKELSNIYIILR